MPKYDDDIGQLMAKCAASAQPISRAEFSKLRFLDGVSRAERATCIDALHGGSVEIALLKADGSHNLARRRGKELAAEWRHVLDVNYRPDDGVADDAGPREMAESVAARRHPGLH